LVCRERERTIDRSTADNALYRLNQLRSAWNEIAPVEDVRAQAFRLLGRQQLRAADSFQLAAALVWTRGAPDGYPFLCFDDRLREAARGEGFAVIDLLPRETP
jgi:hypothetical protein